MIAFQFSEIIALPSLPKKNVTWPQGVPEKFTERKIARIFRPFNFYVGFLEVVVLSAQAMPHRKFDVQWQHNFLKLHCGITNSSNCIHFVVSQVKNACVATALPCKT